MVFRGDRLANLRHLRGMTQADLSQQLQIGRPQVANLERCATEPSMQVLVDIARVFGVSTDYLLGVSNDLNLSSSEYRDEFEPLPFERLG